MRRTLKALAAITLVVLVAIVLAWWWYLRADPMEPPALPGSVQVGSLEQGGQQPNHHSGRDHATARCKEL